MQRFFILVLLLASLALPDFAKAQVTIPAAGCNQSDITDALAGANDGDTITVPAGTCDWGSELTITKGITLQGAGVGQTIIRQTRRVTDGVNFYTAQILVFTLKANFTTRLTGFEFRDNTPVGTLTGTLIYIGGSNIDGSRVRVDNNKINDVKATQIFTNTVIGVIDNNWFYQNHSCACIGVYVYHEFWNGFPYSDASWADPPDFGSENFLFLEDNTFENHFSDGSSAYAITDAYRGARYVVRHNHIINGWVELHGTDSGTRRRGARAVEVYENIFDCLYDPPEGGQCSDFVNSRSGTTLTYNNTLSAYLTAPRMTQTTYRMFWPFNPFGTADGRSVYDNNHPSNPFTTGTAQSGSNHTGGQNGTMTVAGNPWSTDQWKGYTLRKTSACSTTTACGGTRDCQCASVILSNTTNTITYHGSGANDFGCDATLLKFVNGNTFEINKVLETLDQPGRGQGTQMSGATPWPEEMPDPYTNDQIDELSYQWNNTYTLRHPVTGVITGPFVDTWNVDMPYQIREGEHYAPDGTQMPGYVAYTYPHPLRQNWSSRYSGSRGGHRITGGMRAN